MALLPLPQYAADPTSWIARSNVLDVARDFLSFKCQQRVGPNLKRRLKFCIWYTNGMLIRV